MLPGDKSFIGKLLADELKTTDVDLVLETNKRASMQETKPEFILKFIKAKRKIVETVISQLSRVFNIQNFRVRDLWHFTNKITRKILAHNICTMINLKHNLNVLSIESIVN